MLSFVPTAEGSNSNQSWPGLFWLPPADDELCGRDMLHLDDELAGLIEAADPSADQHEAHTTKPEPPPTAPGESFSRDETQVSHVVQKLKNYKLESAMCCGALCCVKLHCSMVLPALLFPHLMTRISCPDVSWHCCPLQGALR